MCRDMTSEGRLSTDSDLETFRTPKRLGCWDARHITVFQSVEQVHVHAYTFVKMQIVYFTPVSYDVHILVNMLEDR